MEDVSGEAFAEEMKQFVLPDESAAIFLARSHAERFWTSVPFIDKQTLQAGHVLEICGASGSAKTQILLQIAVTCILPKQENQVVYGGFGGSAFYFDLDCRLDVGRVLQLLQARINGARRAQGVSPIPFGELRPVSRQVQGYSNSAFSMGKTANSCCHPLIASCLDRFHLIRCHSSFQFLASLKTIRPLFRQLDDNALSTTQLLFIDSISAFYWMDRAALTTLVPSPAAGLSGRPLNPSVVGDAIVRELRQLRRSYKLFVIAARTYLFSSSTSDSFWQRGNVQRSSRSDDISGNDNQASSLRNRGVPLSMWNRKKDNRQNFMPAVWQDFITHRVMLDMIPTLVGGGKEKQVFQAVWDLPSSYSIDQFTVEQEGVCSIERRS